MNRATLDIDLRCAAQGKAITTMVPMIAEHGFNRTEALVIDGLAFREPTGSELRDNNLRMNPALFW